MGIRFYCPNGHKLNVKSFQAGRRGICPFCGAKIIIPSQSTRKSSKAEHAARGGADQEIILQAAPVEQAARQTPGAGVAGEPEPGNRPGLSRVPQADSIPTAAALGGPAAAGPSPSLQNSPPVTPAGQSFGANANEESGTIVGGKAQIHPLPQATELAPSGASAAATSRPAAGTGGPSDPLAEAGNVVWYVRPPSGGQFGPATSDVMRTWIDEGRVSADSLVWREGWRDWLVADDVFPQLGAGKSEFELGGLGSVGPAGASHGRPHATRSRRQQTIRQVGIITLLVLAVCVLVAVFVWVVFYFPA